MSEFILHNISKSTQTLHIKEEYFEFGQERSRGGFQTRLLIVLAYLVKCSIIMWKMKHMNLDFCHMCWLKFHPHWNHTCFAFYCIFIYILAFQINILQFQHFQKKTILAKCRSSFSWLAYLIKYFRVKCLIEVISCGIALNII